MSARRHHLPVLTTVLTVLSLLLLSVGLGPSASAGKAPSSGSGINVKIQGYDGLSKSWTPGNTGGYSEGESIPFRLVLTGPGTLSTLQIVADHLRSGVRGIEDLNNFQVCTGAPTTSPAGATGCSAPNQTSLTVTRDVPDPVSSGVTQVAYTFHNVVIPSSGLVLRWGAELAIGSHLYPGSALHMAVGTATTSSGSVSFGSKDVPIPVNAILATETDKLVNGLDAIGPANALTVGQTVPVTIASKIIGPAKGTQNVTVTDDLPSCLRYAGGAVPTPVSAPTAVDGVVPPGGTVRWTFANVKNGTTLTVSFNATVVTVGSCENVATTSTDKTLVPSTDRVPISSVGRPDVSMVKDCDDVVAPGGVANCTLTYANNGDAVARDVQITDVLDPGLTYVAVEGQPQPSGTPLTWSVGDLAPGEGGVIRYQERVPATGPAGVQQFQDTATVHTPGDSNPGNDSDTETVTTTYAVDLGITKQCPSTLSVNTPTQQSVTYLNHGTAPATGVRVVDTLPSGMTYVSGSASRPPTSVSGSMITWDIGTLPAGSASATITYRVTVTSPGAFTNVATISSDEADADATDNRASCTSGSAYSDVSVDKACPSAAAPGATVTHTLSYANLGNQPAAGVRIVDTLGSGLTYVAGSAQRDGAAITPAVSGQQLTFTLDTVAAGASGQVTYQVRLDATATSAGVKTFTDSATISTSSSNAVNTANDTSACSTRVDYEPHLVLQKSGCRATVVPGGYQTYSLDYANDGSAPATSARLTDTPPAGQPIASAPGAQVTANTALWQLGDLAPGDHGAKSLTVRVDVADGTQVSNTANLTASNAAASDSTSFTTVSGAGRSTHGSAYALDVRALGLVLVDRAVRAQSADPGTPGDSQNGPQLAPSVLGVVNAGILTSASHSHVDIGSATTTSTSTILDLSLLNGMITAKAVRGVAQSTAGPFGAASSTTGSTFTDLVIAGQAIPDQVAPNTVVQLPGGIGSVKLRGESTTATVDGQGRFTTTASVSMIDVTLTGVLTVPVGTHVVVGHAESDATYPSGMACGTNPDTVSGRAFTAHVNTLLQTDVYVDKAEIAPLGGSATADAADVPGLPGVLSASALTNSTSGSIGSPPTSTSRSHAASVDILDGLVTADALDVSATSNADGTTASTVLGSSFVNLRIGSQVINGTVPANFTIDVPSGGGIAHVVLNEQTTDTPTSGARAGHDTEGTVNAVHVRLFDSVGVLTTDVVVVSAHSDAHVG